MTTAVQHRRGTTAEHSTFTGLEGEVTIDTTKDTAVIHDGALAGGYPLAKETLSNVNPSTLSTIDGASTAADDKLVIYDTSASTMKSITRAELNNAITLEALDTVDINGGTIDGTTIGATTASTGAFTTLSASSSVTLSGGTANGVLYLNGSKAATSGANLTYNGSAFGVSNGTQAATITPRGSASGGLAIGTDIASSGHVLNLAGDIVGGGTGGGVNIAYYSSLSSTWNAGLSIRNTASTYSNLLLMPDGGNVGIGTSSPTRLLTVAGTSGDASGIIRLQSADALNAANVIVGSVEYFNVDPSANGSQVGVALNAYTAAATGQGTYFTIHTSLGSGQSEGAYPPERLRIDSSGNVGIGTSSPSAVLDIESTSATQLELKRSGTAGQIAAMIFKDGGDAQNRISSTSSNLVFGYGASNSEAMRIDSSGNLLVARTAPNTYNTTVGFEAQAIGLMNATRDGGVSLILNRLTSDGDIALFRKDGTTVGSIGSATIAGGTNLIIDAPNAVYFGTNIRPETDNVYDVGSSSFRFNDIYATNGTIQTSDANEKQDIEALSEAEARVAVACKGLLRKFRWKDAVAEKGDEARIHFGIIAQDLQAAFAAEGLDAGRYAMFISSTWTDEETGEERTRLGVRYTELLAFIIAAI